jgi:ankyrin repeat protein
VDINFHHPLFGTAVHTAAGSGSPEILKLLLDSGARVNEKNAQGHTPLAALQAARQVLSQFTRLQSLGLPLPEIIKSRLEQALPAAGWDECERLLREAGGR